MKKLVALLLVFIMMFSLVLSGCTEAEPTPTNAPEQPSEQAQQPGNTEPEQPAEPVKLTIWVKNSTKVADYNDNAMTTWLEEKGNFELEVVSIPSADFSTKVNMALTVGAVEDLPDIIIGDSKEFTNSAIMEWADTGSILPLTEYYADPALAENINEAIARTGVDYTAHLYMPDGNIYSIGTYNQSYGNEYAHKLWINKTWLDQLEMEVPTTVEEFITVLEAVRDTDLNGNGKQDEIPFVGATTSYDGYLRCIMNAYFYAGDRDDVFRVVEDGVVSCGATTEEFRQSLEVLRGMFQNGLILGESLTMNADQFKTLVNTEDQTVFAFSFTSPSIFTDLERRTQYISIAPLVGPEGVQFATYEQSVGTHSFVVTANCKNPEAAFKLGDLMSSEFIGISQRFGQQGVDWDYPQDAKNPDDWQSSMASFPMSIVLYDASNFWAAKEPTHNSWMQTGPYVRQYAIANGMSIPKGDPDIYTVHTNDAMVLYQEGGYAPAEHIPTLIYNEEESIVVAEVQATLNSYIFEYIGAVMMGTKNLEGDWDAFQAELEKIGLSDYLAAVQSAYDRMYK